MKKTIPWVFIYCLFLAALANAQFSPNITTIAGNGVKGFNGDGGKADTSELSVPGGIALDSVGNIYISDAGNNRIRRIDAQTNIITTIAGNGIMGFSGDSGLATAAKLNSPAGLVFGKSGNLFFCDENNQRIRKVNINTGIITTVAGTGTFGYSGDGGFGIYAELFNPLNISSDKAGNIYVADQGNSVIRKIDVWDIITTVAGTSACGYSGDGGKATSAKLCYPHGVAIDSVGNMYIADGNNVIREVLKSTGTIITVAGNGTAGYGGDGGGAGAAEFNLPGALTFDKAGNYYIADEMNNRIRKVSLPSGIVTTVAGTGTAGYNGDNIPADSAELYDPWIALFDAAGNMLIADDVNNRIRKVQSVLGIHNITHTATVNCYPNPGKGIFTLEPEGINSRIIIDIYNVFGQLVYSRSPITAAHYSIDLKTQPAGVYIYKITTSTGSYLTSGKIIIE